MTHECNKATNGTSWAHCSACGKRLHLEGCGQAGKTSKDCRCTVTAEYLEAAGIGVEEAKQILARCAGEFAGTI